MAIRRIAWKSTGSRCQLGNFTMIDRAGSSSLRASSDLLAQRKASLFIKLYRNQCDPSAVPMT